MKKLDSKELLSKFNTLRQQNLKKEFTPAELEKLLNSNGFNSSIVSLLKKVPGLFQVQKLSTSRWYSFTEKPLNYLEMEKILKEYCAPKKSTPKKELTPEQEAVKLLVSRGYIVKRPVGLDTDKLRKELPEVYQRYMRYNLEQS